MIKQTVQDKNAPLSPLRDESHMLAEKGPLCAGDLFRYACITFHEPGSILDAYGYIRRDESKISDHCPYFITVVWQWCGSTAVTPVNDEVESSPVLPWQLE
ncbi:hypothetical protein [Brevibacillus brevis]|uniref:hypothetical protein n=1 Tax=Brevibacillus brevis TaxID=1393 RepID=UPI0005A258F2|nr:hypothetical protein [Brevibacillus brevis]